MAHQIEFVKTESLPSLSKLEAQMRTETLDPSSITLVDNNLPQIERDLEKSNSGKGSLSDSDDAANDEGHSELDVGWDGPDDPENPKNWSKSRKFAATFIVSMIALTCGATSSAISPGLPLLGTEFDVTDDFRQSVVFSMYGFAFLLGAMIYGPLSELYGRVLVLNISTAIFLAFNLACGFAPNYGSLLVFRFISSVGGTSTPSIGLGVISDCFNAEDIGQGSAFYGLATQLGPAIGPIIGGFVVQNLTWRWIFHITTIVGALMLLLSLAFLRETRASIKLKKKAKSLVKETGKDFRTPEWPHQEKSFYRLLKGLQRPLVFLFRHHIIQYLAIYQFFLYGTLYLILQTYGGLFETTYGQSIQISSLNYIAVGLGQLTGQQLCARVSDIVYDYLCKRIDSGNAGNPNQGRPEYRVPLMMIGAVVYPLGFLTYGWSAYYATHWIVPNIGIFLVSVGLITVSQGIKLYILNAYGTFASSAQGATNLTRAIGMGAFPLFANKMFDTLGYGWTGTVLAGASIALGIPGPIILWYYGERLRKAAGGFEMKTAAEEKEMESRKCSRVSC